MFRALMATVLGGAPYRRPAPYVLLGLTVLVGGVAPAYAYIDPGTGSMILQIER